MKNNKSQEKNPNQAKKLSKEEEEKLKDLYNVTEAPRNMPENVTGNMKIIMES